MARSVITPAAIVRTGVAQPAAVVSDATNNHYIAANNGRIFLRVENVGVTSRTITVQTPGTVDGLAISDLTVSLAAGDVKYIGPFPPSVYNQADDSLYVDPSADTDLEITAYYA